MKGVTLKQAFIARSEVCFEYSGSLKDGLRIPLESGDSLDIRSDQIGEILGRFSSFNPLLDESTDQGVFCPTSRFQRWLEEGSLEFLGRQLGSDDAMRILGTLNGEGLIEKHFHTGGTRHGPYSNTVTLAMLKECVGQVCIYREKAYFARVRLAKVSGDKQSVTLSLEVIESPGFCSDVAGRFEVSAAFEYLSIENGYVLTSLMSWMLVTNPALVNHLTDFAARMLGKRDFIEEVRSVTSPRR